jgi:hypothetical protein
LEINDLITPLVQKGQSINHIFSTHADEIGVSEKTIYNYIDMNAFDIKNLDLPKKVKYRQRRPQKILTKLEYQCRKGRTIDDFKSFACQECTLSGGQGFCEDIFQTRLFCLGFFDRE